jgi:hypothetical protein
VDGAITSGRENAVLLHHLLADFMDGQWFENVEFHNC